MKKIEPENDRERELYAEAYVTGFFDALSVQQDFWMAQEQEMPEPEGYIKAQVVQ